MSTRPWARVPSRRRRCRRSSAAAWLSLPAVALSLFPLALIIRLTRAGVREHNRMDYVKFARAMGISTIKVETPEVALRELEGLVGLELLVG